MHRCFLLVYKLLDNQPTVFVQYQKIAAAAALNPEKPEKHQITERK